MKTREILLAWPESEAPITRLASARSGGTRMSPAAIRMGLSVPGGGDADN